MKDNIATFTPVTVQSVFLNQPIILDAYLSQETNTYVITHNSLKAFMLRKQHELARDGAKIKIAYDAVESSLSHSVVDCTIECGNYIVTETGESCVATLNTAIAKSYPYLEAQIRAYDRAVISFLQLNVSGKRVYSYEEIA